MKPEDLLIDADSVDQVKQKVHSLFPWLDDPFECECGGVCEPGHEYVAQQAMAVDVWVCRECGDRYYREEKQGFSGDLYR